MGQRSTSRRRQLLGAGCLLAAAVCTLTLAAVNKLGGYEVLNQQIPLHGTGSQRLPFSAAVAGEYELGIEMLSPADSQLRRQVIVLKKDSPLAIDWSASCADTVLAAGNAREAVFVRWHHSRSERIQTYLLGLSSYASYTDDVIARAIGSFESHSQTECELLVSWQDVDAAYADTQPAVFVRRHRHEIEERLLRSQFAVFFATFLALVGTGLCLWGKAVAASEHLDD